MVTGMEEILSLQQIMFARLTVQRCIHPNIVFCILPCVCSQTLSFIFFFVSLLCIPPFPPLFSALRVITMAKSRSQPLKHLIEFSLTRAVIGF